MTPTQPHNYITAIFNVFMKEKIEHANLQNEPINDTMTCAKRQILNFYHNLNHENLNHADREALAKVFIENYHQTQPSTNSLRYRFRPRSNTEELFKLVFDHAFQAKPDIVIAAAEKVERVSFYPKWKHVCWIKAPAKLGSVLGNVVYKIVIAVSFFFIVYYCGFHAYQMTENLINARALPFLINHLSLHIIKAGNVIWDGIKWASKNRFKIFIVFAITKRVISSGPTIPHITERVRNISLWTIYSSLRTREIESFLITQTLTIVHGGWQACGKFGTLFDEAAKKQNDYRLAICRKKAYDTWQTAIGTHFRSCSRATR